MAEIYGFAINVEGNAVTSITAINDKLQGLSSTVKSTSEHAKGLGSTMSMAMGSLLAKGIEVAIDKIKEFASGVYEVGVEIQQTKQSFEVLAGSASKGQELFGDVKKWADMTPYTHRMAYDQAKLMLNYGADSTKITHYLEMIGSAAGGSNERFQSLSYSFSQAISTGKLTGIELKEMMGAGFNPLKALEGTDIAKGSAETQRIQKELNQLNMGTGKSAEKKQRKQALQEELEKARGLNVEYENMKKQIKDGSFTFDMLVKAYEKATGEGGRFNGMMEKQSQTVGGLASTMESYWQSLQVGIFDRITPLLKDMITGSTELAKSLASWISPKQSEILGDMKNNMATMFDVLKSGNLTTEQAKSVRDELNTTYKDYLPNLINEKMSIDDIKKAQDQANLSIETKIRLTLKDEIFQENLEKAKKATKAELEEQEYQEAKKAGRTSSWQDFKHNLGELGSNIGTQFSQLATFWKTSGASDLKNLDPDRLKQLHGDVLTTSQKMLSESGFNLDKYLEISSKKESERSETEQNYMRIFSRGRGAIGTYKTDENVLKMLSEDQLSKLIEFVAIAAPKKAGEEEKKAGGAMGTSAASDVMMGAHGGLGEAKVINITINKMQEINATKIDSNDIEKDGLKAVEEMVRVINNLATNQGTM